MYEKKFTLLGLPLWSASIILTIAIWITGAVATSSEFSLSNPSELVLVFQKQNDPVSVKKSADAVGAYLEKELGVKVSVRVPSDYSASVQALVSKKADFAYTSSLPFLLARRDGGASIVLAEQRTDVFGKQRTEYDSVLVVDKNSPVNSLDDVLADSKKIRLMFTSPTSTSGYLFPYATFVKRGLLQAKQDPREVFQTVGFAGSYTQALEEVIAGRADVAAVSFYTVEGDSAATYLSPEKLKSLKIIARIPGVPTHVLSARSGLSPELIKDFKEAVLKLSVEHPEIFTDVYGTASFVEVSENDHVSETIVSVDYLGLPIEGLAGVTLLAEKNKSNKPL